jgi:hypothetical protein
MPAPRNTKRKYFTVAEANATLPLLRLVVRDITVLAHALREQHRRLARLQEDTEPVGEAEIDDTVAEIERIQEQMRDHERELEQLHVEIKDYLTGLIDFPARFDGRDVYLCWRLGEPDVAHWHELDAGFAGRQKLTKVANR